MRGYRNPDNPHMFQQDMPYPPHPGPRMERRGGCGCSGCLGTIIFGFVTIALLGMIVQALMAW